jgi:hypothetical protein
LVLWTKSFYAWFVAFHLHLADPYASLIAIGTMLLLVLVDRIADPHHHHQQAAAGNIEADGCIKPQSPAGMDDDHAAHCGVSMSMLL